MTTVDQLLNHKGRKVYIVAPDDTVLDAIRKMADKDVGSLIVVEGGRPIGIFTERHYARNVFLKGKSSPKTTVRHAMSERTVFALPQHSLEDCMAIMTKNKIRHLPVLKDEELVGIVSIGDLVQSTIADQKFSIEQLEHYIHS